MNRLYYLKHFDLLSEDLYEFTPQKSVEDALIRLCDIVSQEKRKNYVTFLIFLDIKGAFDNAWWPRVLHLLICI